MIKFSKIRSLNEGYDPQYTFGPPPSGDRAIDSTDSAVFDVRHPESIQRINAYLQSMNSNYIDPTYALRKIQEKLGILGLHFRYPSRRRWVSKFVKPQVPDDRPLPANSISAGNGSEEYILTIEPEEYILTFMGGRHGVLDDKYTVGYDDGIRNKTGYSLKLIINYDLVNNGMVYVKARVQPTRE